mmetsp:Transcript_4420/g.7630  ORF Transcript_4420/g.7630 Transcript_4420/m.7630 type:complete len:201 (-) Transcript_4420:1175-1777(-)
MREDRSPLSEWAKMSFCASLLPLEKMATLLPRSIHLAMAKGVSSYISPVSSPLSYPLFHSRPCRSLRAGTFRSLAIHSLVSRSTSDAETVSRVPSALHCSLKVSATAVNSDKPALDSQGPTAAAAYGKSLSFTKVIGVVVPSISSNMTLGPMVAAEHRGRLAAGASTSLPPSSRFLYLTSMQKPRHSVAILAFSAVAPKM